MECLLWDFGENWQRHNGTALYKEVYQYFFLYGYIPFLCNRWHYEIYSMLKWRWDLPSPSLQLIKGWSPIPRDPQSIPSLCLLLLAYLLYIMSGGCSSVKPWSSLINGTWASRDANTITHQLRLYKKCYMTHGPSLWGLSVCIETKMSLWQFFYSLIALGVLPVSADSLGPCLKISLPDILLAEEVNLPLQDGAPILDV